MPSTLLLQNTVILFTVLFLFSGLYFLIISKAIPLWNYFLSLKILSGALDQKSNQNKLAPFSALALGRLFENSISAIFASYIVFQIYGAGILGWLVLSIPFAMSLDFVIATLANKHAKSIVIPGRGSYRITNPSNLVANVFRSPFLGGIFAGLLLVSALFQGIGIPLLTLHYLIKFTLYNHPVLIAVVFIILILVCGSGKLSRIGKISRWAGIFGLTLFIVLIGFMINKVNQGISSLPVAETFLSIIVSGFVPKNLDAWLRVLTSIGIFWSLIGIGASKVATLSGTIRTEFSAKAGLATMATSPLSVILVAPITIYILQFNINLGLILQSSPILFSFVILSFLLLSISGISGWAYTGRQTMIRFFLNFRYGVFLILMCLGFLLLTFYLILEPAVAVENILTCIILFSALPTFFIFIVIFTKSHSALHEWTRYQKATESRFEIIKDLILLLFHIVPKNLISRVFGWISYIHMPKFIRIPVITAFAKAYAIDLSESKGEIVDYPSLNKFFTRALREGVRLVAHEKNVIISPVDAKMSQFGEIKNGTMIQAKGLSYSVQDLLHGSDHEDKFDAGQFCVLYLSPQDYHRIHNPREGEILGYSYHPGQLFPVNSIMVNGLSGLFPKNERLTTFVQTDKGLIAVIKVGATNVGRITVTYDTVRSNKWFRKERHVNYQTPIYFDRGQELGRFEMGSTVILLMENNAFTFLNSFKNNNRTRYGQILGKF